ncbi:Hsp20/alpha crystallin family protein [Roseovarius sp. S4756]|uniref:Hsp20/alpha crystallin family protein n=1 Tax=Roseovarius maritimus TaxID=3342637 RepID=UPI0037278CBA
MPKQSGNVPVSRESGNASRGLSPWTGFGSLRDEMDRLFDAFEPGLWFDRSPGQTRGQGHAFPLFPAMDLTETEKAYKITAELPGMDPEAVHVKTSNGALVISGEKSEETKEEDASHHLSERRWGSFQRSIRLPENVDYGKIDAQFSKGVLTIDVPKSQAALESEKTIKIKAG